MAHTTELASVAQLEDILAGLPAESSSNAVLDQVLGAAIADADADIGTLQLRDLDTGCLTIAASRGFAEPFLKFFETVTLDDNSACAAALKRRMRVIVDDVSTSYLFVGTPATDVMRGAGVAAVHSTPFISASGRMWGVFSTHWRRPLTHVHYDPTRLERLAAELADHLERTTVRAAAPGANTRCR